MLVTEALTHTLAANVYPPWIRFDRFDIVGPLIKNTTTGLIRTRKQTPHPFYIASTMMIAQITDPLPRAAGLNNGALHHAAPPYILPPSRERQYRTVIRPVEDGIKKANIVRPAGISDWGKTMLAEGSCS